MGIIRPATGHERCVVHNHSCQNATPRPHENHILLRMTECENCRILVISIMLLPRSLSTVPLQSSNRTPRTMPRGVFFLSLSIAQPPKSPYMEFRSNYIVAAAYIIVFELIVSKEAPSTRYTGDNLSLDNTCAHQECLRLLSMCIE